MNLIKINMRMLGIALICLLVAGFTFVACNDDDETSGQVVLHSFGPAGIKHGDKISFIGQNLNKVTAISLPGVELTSSQFASQSSKLIEIIVPQEAQAGKVTLKTPDGDIESKTVLNFLVPVEITSITSEARPGTNITITGSLVSWIEEIVFNEELSVTEFVSKSLTELVVTVPETAQTGYLIFKTGGTKPLTFASAAEFKVTLPAVSAMSPGAIRHTQDLTITGTDLDLVTSIVFPGDLTVTTFESQTATEIVVEVPAGAVKGKLTLKQTAPVDVITENELTIVLPVAASVLPQPVEPGEGTVTITGTDLDLVAKLTLPSSGDVLASAFATHTATEISFVVPVGTKSGSIAYTTIHGYSNSLGANIIVPGEGPPPLPVTLYDETPAPGGGDWSWSGTSDMANTEQFYSGDVSWKFASAGNGGLSSGGITPIDASGTEVFTFALYGGAGTDGMTIACILNDKWDSYNTVNIVEGEWTEYQIPLSSYATVDLTQIVRFAFKVENAAPATIYVDRVGFGAAGPAPLPLSLFDETLAEGGGDWSWEIVVSDKASTEQAYTGDVSWKFETSNGGGLSSGGITGIDASAMTYFSFALYGGPGTDGKQIACILNDKWDSYKTVTLVEGQWTEYQIPLAEYTTVDLSAINRFAFKVEGMSASTIYADRVGFE